MPYPTSSAILMNFVQMKNMMKREIRKVLILFHILSCIINIKTKLCFAMLESMKKKHKGIYYDGESHYFIDGGTEKSGYVPVLMYDAKKKKFYEVIDYGDKEL